MIACCLHLGTYEKTTAFGKDAKAAIAGGLQLTDRSHETSQGVTSQDVDLRNFARVVSACTLGLWAFAAGLLIGTFFLS
ncbi:hypothetical protein UP09_11590 [Bradyrhizobium sp. LTSP885]|nr:hypothetical protein UP09_11590 [Bradyrhizobium sp. LTSP885]